MLNIKNLTFSYKRKGRPVLQDFSLEMQPGRVYGLLGCNGAGKSTLLNLIAGLLTPSAGEVEFNGVNTRKRLPSTLSDMFLVPEEFSLPDVTLESYCKANSAFYPRFSKEDLLRHLETFGISDLYNSDVRMSQLSMGQKKKIFMCFALACNTSLLIMDEPTNGLDIPGKSAFRRFVAGAMTDNRIMIISTHQVRDVERVLDHVVIMNNSSILLNSGLSAITEKLRFVETTDAAVVQTALYSLPSVGGTSVILPNEDDDDTQVNLEILFEFALNAAPGVVESLNLKQ